MTVCCSHDGQGNARRLFRIPEDLHLWDEKINARIPLWIKIDRMAAGDLGLTKPWPEGVMHPGDLGDGKPIRVYAMGDGAIGLKY